MAFLALCRIKEASDEILSWHKEELSMDQQKIGSFLKQLRKEKNLTQEQLAEALNVSGRTVSRWETGSNMPDLSILVELADYYDVDIREIINGERKSENMENELKDTLTQVAEYSNTEKKNLKKKMVDISIATAMLLLFAVILDTTNGFGGSIPERPIQNMTDFATGLALAILVINALYLAGILERVKEWKWKLFHKQS